MGLGQLSKELKRVKEAISFPPLFLPSSSLHKKLVEKQKEGALKEQCHTKSNKLSSVLLTSW